MSNISFLNPGELRLNVNFHRPGFFLNKLKLFGEGVEVGTWLGDWANEVLTTWKGKKLWCVDFYKRQPSEIYNDFEQFSQEELDEIYQKVKERLSVHGNRVEILREFSVEAASSFEDGQLDFAYIDANHEPGEVYRDLEAWFPKVKEGGLIFGDDYRFDIWPGLVRDVDRFFKEKQLPLFFQKSYWDRMSFTEALQKYEWKFADHWEKKRLECWETDGLDNWYVFK